MTKNKHKHNKMIYILCQNLLNLKVGAKAS